MEKICIVKLRKKIAPALCPAEIFIRDTAPAQRGEHDMADGTAYDPDAMVDPQNVPSQAISLTLTPEQTRTLRTNPRLMSSLSEQPDERFKVVSPHSENLVIQLTFVAVTSVRLLKIGEVVRMLQIGQGLVRKLIRQGHLKGYRVGRLQRVLLDDVLSYLEANQEHTESPAQPEAPRAKTADRAFA